MTSSPQPSPRGGTRRLLALGFTCSTVTLAWGHYRGPAPAQAPDRLDATIFAYDGHEFVRTKTTLVNEAGKSAANSRLDHSNPAYKALVQKHSYSGDALIFGKHYDANYAPLTGSDGHLTGALFVAAPR